MDWIDIKKHKPIVGDKIRGLTKEGKTICGNAILLYGWRIEFLKGKKKYWILIDKWATYEVIY